MSDDQILIADYRLKTQNTARAPQLRVNTAKRWFTEYPSERSRRGCIKLVMELRKSDDPTLKRMADSLRLFVAKRAKMTPRKKKLKGVPPSGATMRVPGSDGKDHWSDGVNDLGVCND